MDTPEYDQDDLSNVPYSEVATAPEDDQPQSSAGEYAGDENVAAVEADAAMRAAIDGPEEGDQSGDAALYQANAEFLGLAEAADAPPEGEGR